MYIYMENGDAITFMSSYPIEEKACIMHEYRDIIVYSY